MGRMGTVANSAEAVEGRNSEGGGKVAVGAAPYRRFIEAPPQVMRDRDGRFE